MPRCHTCGLPELPGNALLTFTLIHERAVAGWYRLCERCFGRVNPPPTRIDPLEVSQTA